MKIVVIGTGLAGYMFLKEFRKLDEHSELVVVTKSGGDFYSKPLLSTALTSNKKPEDLVINTAEAMANQLQAKLYTHTEVQSIHPQEKCIQLRGQRISYDKLVLACGSDTLPVALLGNAIHKMQSVNDLEAYRQYRHWLTPDKKKIAILGSGLVGCEFANDLLNKGHEIEIISLDSYPLAKFIPEPMGKILQQAFEKKGVRWHLSSPAKSVDEIDHKYHLSLAHGEVMIADGVFCAVGLRANTDLAKGAALAVNRGIVVDRYLQTSDRDIYALGDCAEVAGELKQYVAPLLQCARQLAKNLTENPEPVVYPAMPIVIKTPICPLVTIPVPTNVDGAWHYEGDGHHWQALFYDQNHELRGFTLMGDKVRDKFELAKQLSASPFRPR